MNKREIDQLNMLLAVENHFENDVPIWTTNVLISDAKTALSEMIAEITDEATLQRRTSKGATMSKAALRSDLEAKGLSLSMALGAYISLNPEHEKQLEDLIIPKSEFHIFNGSDLFLAIIGLNDGAMLIIEALGTYGVTQATLTDLMAANDAFYHSLKEPKEAIRKRKTATDTLPVLLHNAISMLENTMDRLIVVLQAAHPEFVNVYFLDRTIHDIGIHTLSLEITTLNANDNTPLNDAHIEVVGKGIKRISNKSGQNRVQNLVEGNYTLSVNRIGFVPQMVPFMIVSGETTQVVVQMQNMLQEASE